MTNKELVQALRRIAADNHRCFGCGYEHNCNIHGCQIIKAAADTIARLSAHVGQVEQERDAAIADILGGNYDLDHLRELVQADREGGQRVVLPPREFFKALGDNVYIINYGEILEALLCYIGYDAGGVDCIEAIYAPMCEDEERFVFRFPDVGKTVFLTRKAAEKALEEMEGE